MFRKSAVAALVALVLALVGVGPANTTVNTPCDSPPVLTGGASLTPNPPRVSSDLNAHAGNWDLDGSGCITQYRIDWYRSQSPSGPWEYYATDYVKDVTVIPGWEMIGWYIQISGHASTYAGTSTSWSNVAGPVQPLQ